MPKNESQTDFSQLLEKFRNKSEEHRDACFSILASTHIDLKTLLDQGGSGFNTGKAEILGSIHLKNVVYGIRHSCHFFAECTGRFEKPFQDFKLLACQAGRILPAKYCDVVRTHLLIDPRTEIERWLSFMWWSAMEVDPANDDLSRCSQRLRGQWVQFDLPFRESADAIDREELYRFQKPPVSTADIPSFNPLPTRTESEETDKLKSPFYKTEGTPVPDAYQENGRPCGPLVGNETNLALETSDVPPDDLVTREVIATLVHLSSKSMTPYTNNWPTPDVPHRGRRPEAWSYQKILPTLRKQFPGIDFPSQSPSAR